MSKLSSHPNMQPEVLEAIHEYFKDNPEIEVDCLLYLASLRDNSAIKRAKLSAACYKALERYGYCSKCGERKQVVTIREPHPELDGCPYENITEEYCPNCDLPGQIKLF